MKNKLHFFLFIFLFIAQLGFAQKKCATAELEQQRALSDPEWKNSRTRFEQKLREHIRSEKGKQLRTTAGAALFTIPVVVHVIHNVANGSIGGKNIPEQQILDQIAVLNEDYRRLNADTVHTPSSFKSVAADVQIEFCLAVRDPYGKPTNGIVRVYNSQPSFNAYSYSDETYLKSLSYWPSDQYLNIWVCDLANGVLGYAQFPSDNTDDQGPASTDGVVIDYSTFGRNVATSIRYNLGRTTTHEVGHWLDLIHTWGDASDCSGNDFCDDVPPCSDDYYSNKPLCSAPTQCSGQVRMIQNYMDYSDDACMNIFTADQKTRMHSAMTVSPRRMALQNSLGCCNTCYVPNVSFSASNTKVKLAQSIVFTDQSSGDISTYSWDFGSDAVPSTATGAGPHTVYYTSTGYKNVSLALTGAYGNDNITKNNYIFVETAEPQADFIASKTSGIQTSETIIFTDQSYGIVFGDYNWDFGVDAVPSTATGKGPHTVSYNSAGLKSVTLTSSISSPQTISSTQIKNHYISVVPLNIPELIVYPNPAKENVSLAMMFQNPEKLNLMIFDRLGKQVFSKEYAETTLYNEVIDIKNWADGMYVIKLIIGDNQTSYWKLLVMK